MFNRFAKFPVIVDELAGIDLQANSELWRVRAYRFGQAIDDKLIKRKEKALKSDKTEVKYPFSLTDGMAGEISFLCDLLNDEKEVR